MISFFAIKRVRISCGKQAAYDQIFHLGVNIIRGENSSAKSTIADFIFYALGGEYDRWKDAAAQCSGVRLGIETENSLLTIHRSVGGKQEPVFIYYGNLEESLTKGIDEWQRVPIRRPSGGKDLSYTQVLFRAIGIPEAPSIDNSNVTMHQILRLLYSDQQTPAGKLFRFESFNTRDIREAVGHLVVGVNSYELYEGQIKLRDLKASFADKDRLYKAALLALPSSEGLASMPALNLRVEKINSDRTSILDEIIDVDAHVGTAQSEAFISERQVMQDRLRKLAALLQEREQKVLDLAEEKIEIEQFLDHLVAQLAALNASDSLSDKLGAIEFQYCPACLKPLEPSSGGKHCIVCHEVADEDKEKPKYIEIKIDNELQIRESHQLLTAKAAKSEQLAGNIRALRREYSTMLMEFSGRYDVTNSPRESFLAERNKLLGRLERELSYFEELRATIAKIDQLSTERASLND